VQQQFHRDEQSSECCADCFIIACPFKSFYLTTGRMFKFQNLGSSARGDIVQKLSSDMSLPAIRDMPVEE
jgi:hypothetical protein